MWCKPTQKQLSAIPALYETEKVPIPEKLVHMHFFIGACDWYITEYDPEERIFFCYAILNGDTQNAEWGYTSFDELIDIKTRTGVQVDRDRSWKPTPVKSISKIRQRG
jgi:hypothetical protein